MVWVERDARKPFFLLMSLRLAALCFAGWVGMLGRRFLGKLGITDKEKWRTDDLFVFIIIVFLNKKL